MKPTLADSLNIIMTALATEIATPEARVRLQKLAKLLPPIVRGVFECRLSQDMNQFDLQQCIIAKDNSPKILAEHLAALTSYNNILKGFAWRRIQDFSQVWLDSKSVLHDGITDIWLEFDIDDSQCLHPPSIFLSFNSKCDNVEQLLTVVETALELLLSRSASRIKSQFFRGFTTCPIARISHVGVMLSRQLELRVNVSNVPIDQIAAYLHNIGFSGSAKEIETLTAQLLNFVDIVRICLDVGTTIYPKVGLECFLTDKSDLESRWSSFLEYLVQQGLCTSEKRNALLAWVGYTTPQSSPYPWPSHLIAESFLKPPNQFSAFVQRLSHIKVVHSPQQPLQAKGYLEFSHQWLQPEEENL